MYLLVLFACCYMNISLNILNELIGLSQNSDNAETNMLHSEVTYDVSSGTSYNAAVNLTNNRGHELDSGDCTCIPSMKFLGQDFQT